MTPHSVSAMAGSAMFLGAVVRKTSSSDRGRRGRRKLVGDELVPPKTPAMRGKLVAPALYALPSSSGPNRCRRWPCLARCAQIRIGCFRTPTGAYRA